MGCISSKIATRSRSFREEFSQSLQKRINGLPMLDDLLTSKDGGEQFLALVCTANTVSKKHQTEIPPSKSNTDGDQPVEHINPETINTSKLMTGLEEEQQRQQSPHQEEGHNDQSVTADDFHQSKEHILASGGKCTVISNNSNVGASLGDTGVLTQSRSFHTVEEYDALVRAQQSEGVNTNVGAHLEQFNNLNMGKANGSFGDNILHKRSPSFNALEGSDTNGLSAVGGDTRSSSNKSTLQSQHIGMVKKGDESTIKDQYISTENKESSKNSFKNLELKNIDRSECPSSTCTTDVASINEDISKKANITVEKGFRRKAKAKELTALNIPTTTVDFPVIGSLGEWLELGGQVFSPGDYVTPRFGNFSVPISVNGNDGRAIFDPEMLAAFEESMKELTVEEECILKQIEEDMDEDGKITKEVEEKISNHIQVQ